MSDSVQKSSLSVVFYKFKESPYYSFTLFFFVFVVALSLLVFAVVPQVQSIFTLNDEINKTQKSVEILKSNEKFMTTINNSNLQKDLQITFEALPSQKDFVGILNVINNSAATTGVTLDDYSLLIGELATPSAGLESYFTLSTDIIVAGNKESITNFLKLTQQKLPISEIDSIDLGVGDNRRIEATIKLIFFFKVYKNESYSVATPIAPISPESIKSIETIKGWKDKEEVVDDVEVATDSSVLSDPF